MQLYSFHRLLATQHRDSEQPLGRAFESSDDGAEVALFLCLRGATLRAGHAVGWWVSSSAAHRQGAGVVLPLNLGLGVEGLDSWLQAPFVVSRCF